MDADREERQWSPLAPRERRVLGVLVEKQKTTPDAYPMSIAALVTGCNQKSNRDPVTSDDADDIEETLFSLRKKGAAIQVEGSGRVEKWRHNLYEWLDLKNQPIAMAVLAELLLRGAQTEGELRGRASRMDAIPDLEALQTVLKGLEDRGLVVFLSPPGRKRGVVVTHGLYPPSELERIRQLAAQLEGDDEPPAPRPSPAPRNVAGGADLDALRDEVRALRSQVDALTEEVRVLKESLGS